MCGICGVFGTYDGETVGRMLRTLAHRGPDDQQAVGSPDFSLGARRLSIVDVDGGRQPLSDESGTVWAAQNGEIYNFPTLRRQLLESGHTLRTLCDTEVLPHLYEEYGCDLPKKIDGMFAVAVWDDRRKRGLLARDRMGKKPLYYWVRPDGVLYFASEIKALLEVPGIPRRLNFEALHHFLSFKHVPHPHSIFEGVRILPPAHALIFEPGREPRVERYWRVDFDGGDDLDDATEAELIDRLLELLRDGIRRRLMADVPIGFFLSGGIDSSLSTAIAAEMSSTPIKTFTLTYADGSTTEGKELDRRWARWVSERYATESFEETIGAFSFPEKIRTILGAFDEPFAGVISTYFLSALVARHVKVAVSGDGADELFGSYLSHRLAGPVARFSQYRSTGDVALIQPFEYEQDRLAALAGRPEWDWRGDLFVFNEQEKQRLYAPAVRDTMSRFSSVNLLRSAFDRATAREPLNRMLEAEFGTIFPDQVLTFVDRLSMAHSLEIRTAYLDTDLVTFVARLPDRMKIRGGDTKYLLKQAALRYFPPEMVFRKKEGFLMPVADWLSNDLEPYVRDVLSPARLERHGLFDPSEVERLMNDMYQRKADYTQVNKVLSLVVFQEWYDLYLP
jgi:asparagine synthase (glutamine-hydrolysing)